MHAVLVSGCLALAAAPAPQLPVVPALDLATLMPGSTLIYAEAGELGGLLARATADPLGRAIAAAPAARSLAAALDDEGRQAIELARELLGGSIHEGLGALLARGAAVGMSFQRAKPTWLAAARASDAARLTAMLEGALDALAEKYGVGDALDEPADTIDGADVWYLGEKLALARLGDLLLLAPDEGALRGALDRATDPAEADLADQPSFTAARARRAAPSGGDIAWAWADLGRARELADKLPPEKRPLKELMAMARNPGAHALLGSGVAHLGTADSIALSLRAHAPEPGFALELRADGAELATELLPGGPVPPPLPGGSSVTPPLPGGSGGAGVADGGECLAALLYRDLAALSARRTELFEPESLPGIQEAIAGLALFFGGADFGEEILPRVSPWIRVVSRPAEFSAESKPEIEYPAAALLLELAEPERDGPAFIAAFQSLVAVANVERAQQRQPPMRLALGREGDVEISAARFAPPRPGEGVDQSYNLAPAIALVRSTLIAGTHESLVRALVRDLVAGRVEPQTPATEPVAPAAERLRLGGPALASFLQKNLEAIALSNSLEEGKPIERTRIEAELLADLVASFARLDAELVREGETSLVLRVALPLAAPAAQTAAEPR